MEKQNEKILAKQVELGDQMEKVVEVLTEGQNRIKDIETKSKEEIQEIRSDINGLKDCIGAEVKTQINIFVQNDIRGMVKEELAQIKSGIQAEFTTKLGPEHNKTDNGRTRDDNVVEPSHV
ncbi:hypothetical protein Pcinc_032912 [Petrolisthes cinctipes]|uniref:Uncharacterized protein n=1 Tax=Petrolisthes cinctipes TaxID=88211 RepID=A0AAE1K2N3_PETCI|nr:hypothetical protein Pcinc_032912 [Petrolisthes cinctipes]